MQSQTSLRVSQVEADFTLVESTVRAQTCSANGANAAVKQMMFASATDFAYAGSRDSSELPGVLTKLSTFKIGSSLLPASCR